MTAAPHPFVIASTLLTGLIPNLALARAEGLNFQILTDDKGRNFDLIGGAELVPREVYLRNLPTALGHLTVEIIAHILGLASDDDGFLNYASPRELFGTYLAQAETRLQTDPIPDRPPKKNARYWNSLCATAWMDSKLVLFYTGFVGQMGHGDHVEYHLALPALAKEQRALIRRAFIGKVAG